MKINEFTIDSTKNWYAIYTKSRFEKKTNDALQSQGFKTFLPLIKTKRIWSDRIKTVQLPLLPNYVFIHINKAQLSRIYGFPGFVRFVSFEGQPCCIKASDIQLLEQIVTHGYKVQPSSYCQVGDAVSIIRGPLRGWEGKVESVRGNHRIVFQFDCLRQAISVEVPLSHIEKRRIKKEMV